MASSRKKAQNVRLSGNAIPVNYKVTLKPDLEKFTFGGEEKIDLKIQKPTNQITLHSVDLKIKGVEVKVEEKLFKAKVSYNKRQESATFTFQEKLPIGVVELYVRFSGVLNDQMRGFYRSMYEVGGKKVCIATTQFEATDARRAFPCFDEPAMKATFEVCLWIPKGSRAISNTIEEEILEHESGYQIVNFAKTPKMSTYLLAFIVGDFEHVEVETQKGVKVRVFTTPGKKHQAEFALDTAVRTLAFYEEYFGIEYPLPTLDLIAIPDFAAGAMENWGAVTYRETALLVDPENSSAANKQWVALVIAHELAHQWFGNLVTMEWWTHLWLNEGFASFIEYLAVDHLYPDWDIWTQFIDMDHGRALYLDGLSNTHAIEIEVKHPTEISEIFDAVSYSKGASIIRMLAEYLGETAFRDGLRQYLKTHSYANATTQDLWEAFEKVSKKPVGRMMGNWTRKPGYPLIKLKESSKGIRLLQSRFYSSPASFRESKDNTVWTIPISVLDSKKKKEIYLMDQKTLNLPRKNGDWVKLNVGETALMRVDYPSSYMDRFEDPIKKKMLSPVDRFAVLRDAFELSKAGFLPTDKALSLVTHYSDEDSYTVWSEISSGLGRVKSLLIGQESYEDFKTFSKEIFTPLARKLGWEKSKDEGHTTTLLRNIALFGAGSNGDLDTIKRAQKIFENIETSPIDADIRGIVYNLSAKYGDEKIYNKLKKLYDAELLQEEKNRLLSALCVFPQQELLERTLAMTFSEEVRSQETFRIIDGVFANPMGRDLAWQYVQENWQIILKKYGSGGHMLPRFIEPAGIFASEEKAAEVKRFFRKNKAPGGERTIAQTIEQIYARAEWLARDGERIKEFLKTR